MSQTLTIRHNLESRKAAKEMQNMTPAIQHLATRGRLQLAGDTSSDNTWKKKQYHLQKRQLDLIFSRAKTTDREQTWSLGQQGFQMCLPRFSSTRELNMDIIFVYSDVIFGSTTITNRNRRRCQSLVGFPRIKACLFWKQFFFHMTSMIHIVVVKDIPRNLCPTYIKRKGL